MILEWVEFIHSLEVMSKICGDKFYYEISFGNYSLIELKIIEDDDILFSDDFDFLIFKDSIVFSYNNYNDIHKSDNFELNKNYIIEQINKIRRALEYKDFDDRLSVIKGEL